MTSPAFFNQSFSRLVSSLFRIFYGKFYGKFHAGILVIIYYVCHRFLRKKTWRENQGDFFFFQTWKYNRNKSWKHLVEKRRKFRKIFNQQKFLNLGIQPVSTYQELPQIPMENFSPILVPSDNTLPLHFLESQRRKHNQNSVR